MSDQRWLIAGLGNPGTKYAGNRHNIGFMVADALAVRAGSRFRRGTRRSHAASGSLAGLPVVIVKPTSYMNESGGPIRAAAAYYKIAPAHVIVIHDDLDLPFRVIRLKLGGGDNGHNGLRSVTAAIGTRNYYRVRVGIGRPPGRQDPADFVLSDFAASEREELAALVGRGADAVEILLSRGLGAAQNEVHPGSP